MDIPNLISSFGGLAYTLVAFIVALSVIVAIHEYGHYIVGRWCGIDAETFSLGFGPVIYSRVDKRGTKWQLAALPFGGFVKFLGDSNAASVGSDETVKAARNTMHGAPLWARAATVAAGPVFNFIFSIIIFAAVILFAGRAADPLTVDKGRPFNSRWPQNASTSPSQKAALKHSGWLAFPPVCSLNPVPKPPALPVR